MRLENIELHPAGLPTESGYPKEMVEFARHTTCLRDFWQGPINQITLPVEKFERVTYQERPLVINGQEVLLWEETPNGVDTDARRHRVMFLDTVAVGSMPAGTLRLEYVDMGRQIADTGSRPGFLVEHSFWNSGIYNKLVSTLNKFLAGQEHKASSIYRAAKGEYRVDYLYMNGKDMQIVGLGKLFEVLSDNGSLKERKDQVWQINVGGKYPGIYEQGKKVSEQPDNLDAFEFSIDVQHSGSAFYGTTLISKQEGKVMIKGPNAEWIMDTQFPAIEPVKQDDQYCDDDFRLLLGIWDKLLPHWRIALPNISFG
jgi:hypothetical protein